MSLVQSTNVTVGDPIKIIVSNTTCELVGDIPLDALDTECKFFDMMAAKAVREKNFDPEKDAALNEALMSATMAQAGAKDANAAAPGRRTRGAADDITLKKQIGAVKRAKNDNCIHLFDKNTKKFPIGLLHRVKEILRREGLDTIVEDTRVFPAKEFDWKFSHPTKTPRDHQIEGAAQSDNHPILLYDWATNAGKTLLMSLIAARKGVKTLVLTHSGHLAYQIAEAFEEWLGVKPGMVLAGKANLQPITVGVINSARNLIGQLNEYGFQMIMVDEAHRAAAKSYVNVLSRLNCVYSYGFTGTPDRRSADKLVIEAVYGVERPKISNQEMIEAGFSCPVKVEFIKVDQTGECNRTDPYQLVYKNGIVDSTSFNTAVVQCILDHLEEDRVIAVQVAQKLQGQIIYFTLLENGVKVALVDGDSSAMENHQKLKALHRGDYEVVIGTVINEGFDCDRLDVVVNAAGYMAGGLTKQKLGRVLRSREGKECGYYVDFYSFGHPILEKHSRVRAETLEKEGFKVDILVELRAIEAAEKERMMLEHAEANKKFDAAKKTMECKGSKVAVTNKSLAKTKFAKIASKEISLDSM